MSSARTRKQVAAATAPAPAPPGDQVTMNGNGASSGAVKNVEPRENIFLFYPNLIGKCSPSKTSDHV